MYKTADVDVTDQLGFKFFIAKLSGNAKFDLDTKVTKEQFYHLIEECSMVEVPEEGELEVVEGEEAKPMKQVFDQEQYTRISQAFEQALSPAAATPMYGSDPNAADYLHIISVMRAFNPEKYATPAEAVEEQQ